MIPINVFYDTKVCSAKDIILDYMKDIPKEYQTKKYYGKPVFLTKYNCRIEFEDSVILFLPVRKELAGMRAKICFVPEHMKNDKWIETAVLPIMTSPLLGYYDQKAIKTKGN